MLKDNDEEVILNNVKVFIVLIEKYNGRPYIGFKIISTRLERVSETVVIYI